MGLYRVTERGTNGARTVSFAGERGVASTEVRETHINTIERTCDNVNCSRVVITGEECVHLMVGDDSDGNFNVPGYVQRTVPIYLQKQHVLDTVRGPRFRWKPPNKGDCDPSASSLQLCGPALPTAHEVKKNNAKEKKRDNTQRIPSQGQLLKAAAKKVKVTSNV